MFRSRSNSLAAPAESPLICRLQTFLGSDVAGPLVGMSVSFL